MTPDELELAKKGIGELFRPYHELIGKILGPAATELGSALGDTIGLLISDPLRCRRLERLARLWQRVKAMLDEARVEPQQVPDKLSVPILAAASLEDDDDLRERWAALLANAADGSSGSPVRIAFPDILRQLSPVEAGILDKMYDKLFSQLPFFAHLGFRPIPQNFSLGTLTEVFEWYSKEFHDDDVTLRTRFHTILDNLRRLELVTERSDLWHHDTSSIPTLPSDSPESDAGKLLWQQITFNKRINNILSRLRTQRVFMTDLGVDFVQACRSPKPPGFQELG